MIKTFHWGRIDVSLRKQCLSFFFSLGNLIEKFNEVINLYIFLLFAKWIFEKISSFKMFETTFLRPNDVLNSRTGLVNHFGYRGTTITVGLRVVVYLRKVCLKETIYIHTAFEFRDFLHPGWLPAKVIELSLPYYLIDN